MKNKLGDFVLFVLKLCLQNEKFETRSKKFSAVEGMLNV